jgi:hypothetical protein
LKQRSYNDNVTHSDGNMMSSSVAKQPREEPRKMRGREKLQRPGELVAQEGEYEELV